MKTRTLFLAFVLLFSFSLFAGDRVTRTVVVKDGKVVTDSGDVLELHSGELLGGKRAWLGVSLIDLTPELRDHYGAPKDAGVLVGSIAAGSPAEKAGVKVGDLVIAIDGTDVDSSLDLRRELRDKKDGDSVRIDVLRGRSRQSLVATVIEKEGLLRIPGAPLEGLPRALRSPEWKARIESLGDCGELQSRIKDLETRLKDLEKKLNQ